MQTVNLQQAESDLAALIARMHGGESLMIAKDGELLAQLTRVAPTSALSQKRTPMEGLGMLAGVSRISDDMKTPFAAEIEEMFYGNPDKFNQR